MSSFAATALLYSDALIFHVQKRHLHVKPHCGLAGFLVSFDSNFRVSPSLYASTSSVSSPQTEHFGISVTIPYFISTKKPIQSTYQLYTRLANGLTLLKSCLLN